MYTTEDIPACAFVCEMVGQYVLGKSVVVNVVKGGHNGAANISTHSECVTESLMRGIAKHSVEDKKESNKGKSAKGYFSGAKGLSDRRVTPVMHWEQSGDGRDTAVELAEKVVVMAAETASNVLNAVNGSKSSSDVSKQPPQSQSSHSKQPTPHSKQPNENDNDNEGGKKKRSHKRGGGQQLTVPLTVAVT